MPVRVHRTRVPGLKKIGLPEAVAKIARRKRELILIMGPKSSGKSTMLAAMMELRNISYSLDINKRCRPQRISARLQEEQRYPA